MPQCYHAAIQETAARAINSSVAVLSLCSHAAGPRRSAGWFLFGAISYLLIYLFDIFTSSSAVFA